MLRKNDSQVLINSRHPRFSKRPTEHVHLGEFRNVGLGAESRRHTVGITLTRPTDSMSLRKRRTTISIAAKRNRTLDLSKEIQLAVYSMFLISCMMLFPVYLVLGTVIEAHHAGSNAFYNFRVLILLMCTDFFSVSNPFGPDIPQRRTETERGHIFGVWKK